MNLHVMSSGWPLALILLAPTLHAAPPHDYAGAKATADADEASLDPALKEMLVQQQRTLLDAGIQACATDEPHPDFSAFVIVTQLEAGGRITATWRQGDSPLARCIERYVRNKTAFAPPRNPFYASLEVSFEK